MIQAIETIDAHVGGQPLRLITGGVPRVRGGTMASKRESMTRQADRLRRAIVLEPRGLGVVHQRPVLRGESGAEPAGGVNGTFE